ncbi:hypothetical protein GCM10010392_33520 [Streptomyces clavifer]|nr:hypothetical protein GCM10010392_33520 [Streptomyces clavifer]
MILVVRGSPSISWGVVPPTPWTSSSSAAPELCGTWGAGANAVTRSLVRAASGPRREVDGAPHGHPGLTRSHHHPGREASTAPLSPNLPSEGARGGAWEDEGVPQAAAGPCDRGKGRGRR